VPIYPDPQNTRTPIGLAFTTIDDNPKGVDFEGTLGTPNYESNNVPRGIPTSVGSVYCYDGTVPNVGPLWDICRFNPVTKGLDKSTAPSRQPSFITFDCK
jgi:hypothetical protein